MLFEQVCQGCNGLQFEKYLVFHNEIKALSANSSPLVVNSNHLLALEGNVAQTQFIGQSFFVYHLQLTGSQRIVDIEYDLHYLIDNSL